MISASLLTAALRVTEGLVAVLRAPPILLPAPPPPTVIVLPTVTPAPITFQPVFSPFNIMPGMETVGPEVKAGFGSFIKAQLGFRIWDDLHKLDPIRWIWAKVVDLGKEIIGQVTRFVTGALRSAFDWFHNFFRSLLEMIWSGLDNLFKGHSPIEPEDAPLIALGAFGLATGLGIGAHVTAALGDASHPIKPWGLQYLAGFMGELAGWGRISAASIGVMLAVGLRRPFEYYTQQRFRPNLLRDRELFMLISRDAIEHPEVLQVPELTESIDALAKGDRLGWGKRQMGYLGYRNDFWGIFKELGFTRLGYFPLAGVAATGFWDEVWFREALARTGYSPTAKARLMDMFRERRSMAMLGPVMYQLRRLSREGFITLDGARAHMDAINALPGLTEARVYGMQLEKEYENDMDVVGLVRYAFVNDLTGEDEYSKGLAAVIHDPQKMFLIQAHDRLHKEMTYRRRKKADMLRFSMPQLRRLAREGFLTLNQVRAYIDYISNIVDETAAKLFAMVLERMYDDSVDLLGIYRYAYRNDVIDDEEFKGYLETTVADEYKRDIYFRRDELRKRIAAGWERPAEVPLPYDLPWSAFEAIPVGFPRPPEPAEPFTLPTP